MQTLSVAAKTEDGTWDNTDAAVWSFVELSVGVLAACLPTLRPIFAKMVPRLFNSSVRHGASGYHFQAAGSATRKPPTYVGNGTQKSNASTEELYGTKEEFGLRNMPRDHEDYAYNVSVSGGKRPADLESPDYKPEIRTKTPQTGIQTTTMVTQRVEFSD